MHVSAVLHVIIFSVLLTYFVLRISLNCFFNQKTHITLCKFLLLSLLLTHSASCANRLCWNLKWFRKVTNGLQSGYIGNFWATVDPVSTDSISWWSDFANMSCWTEGNRCVKCTAVLYRCETDSRRDYSLFSSTSCVAQYAVIFFLS